MGFPDCGFSILIRRSGVPALPETEPALFIRAMNWPLVKAVALLICSNVFMTFAWYAHLKDTRAKPWFVATAVSWGHRLH